MSGGGMSRFRLSRKQTFTPGGVPDESGGGKLWWRRRASFAGGGAASEFGSRFIALRRVYVRCRIILTSGRVLLHRLIQRAAQAVLYHGLFCNVAAYSARKDLLWQEPSLDSPVFTSSASPAHSAVAKACSMLLHSPSLALIQVRIRQSAEVCGACW